MYVSSFNEIMVTNRTMVQYKFGLPWLKQLVTPSDDFVIALFFCQQTNTWW